MPEEDTAQGEGRFNIAIKYLLDISEILKDIKNISLRTSKPKDNDDYLELGIGQSLKLKLVRNLYVQSSSLFKTKSETKKIWNKIKAIKIKLKDTKKDFIVAQTNWIPEYNSKIEDELDEIIISIEQELQLSKYFMPKKREGDLF